MKWIRRILKGISFTAVLFVFQACYGPMEEYREGPLGGVTLRVTDGDNGQPLPDIIVESRWQDNQDEGDINWMTSWYEQGQTDSTGTISLEMQDMGSLLKLRFSDKDSVYTVKDTIISNLDYDTVDIVLTRTGMSTFSGKKA